MSELDQYLGQNVHCEEMETNRGARFSLAQKGANTDIFDFDKYFNIIEENPIFLRTEHNDIVSLYKNVKAAHGSSSRLNKPQRTMFYEKIFSLTSIIGPDLWNPTDFVRHVSFTVDGADEILRNKNLLGEIANNGTRNLADTTIFNLIISDFSLGAWYGISENSWGTSREVKTHYTIEFKQGILLDEYLNYVLRYTAFLSFAVGLHLTPSKIRICKQSRSDMIEAIEQQNYLGDYSANHSLSHEENNQKNSIITGNLVRVWDDKEQEIFSDCLALWMNRKHDWASADALMMEAFATRGAISANRLINACKWFEEIPETEAKQAITEDDISEIVACASSTAKRLGYANLDNRIRGALTNIKVESKLDQFQRLLDNIRKKFGNSVLGQDILIQLKAANRKRGKAAHGAFFATDSQSLNEFALATFAMEAFCFLLTAKDLPLGPDNNRRLDQQPMVAQYTW